MYFETLIHKWTKKQKVIYSSKNHLNENYLMISVIYKRKISNGYLKIKFRYTLMKHL